MTSAEPPLTFPIPDWDIATLPVASGHTASLDQHGTMVYFGGCLADHLYATGMALMWDDSAPSVDDESQEAAEPGGEHLWTDGQLMRLENEWRRAQRSFAYHPAIGIMPLRGDPPFEYQLDFRVRTLVLNDAGELQYVDDISMHVWLPPGFPNEAPVVRPMTGVFHPNVTWDGIYLSNSWQSTDTLVDLAARVGALLAFRAYDPESVVNPVAMDWLTQNSGALPLDTHSDFGASAGGEPLGRIMRLGPATLDQVRRALDDMRFALAAENDTPTREDVEKFAGDTRAALSLFLDSDIPEHLREQASEFDDWCRELPASVPMWDYLRVQRSAAMQTDAALVALRDAVAAMEGGLAELEGLVKNPSLDTPQSAAKVIPPMSVLAPIQLKLPVLARQFEQCMAELRRLLDVMKTPMPRIDVAPEGSLGRRLTSLGDSVQQATAAAIESAQTALSSNESLARRASAEVLALEQVVSWRDYLDLFAKAQNLEQQIAKWGSAGVQAYFIENASGTFGPYQYEEALDLGGVRVAVRNMKGREIQAINAVGQQVLGRSSEGAVTLVLGQTDDQPGYDTTLRLTERCDDLAVQFDFIQRQTADVLGGLQRPVVGARSWCGKVCSLLASPRAQQLLRDVHRKSAHHWKTIIFDLGATMRFKERLATFHLLSRMSEEVPRVQELIRAAKDRLKDATQQISAIMSRSSRDVETDRMIVPPKFAKTYNEQMEVRDQAKREIARQESLLKQISRDLSARLSSSRYCGRPEEPPLRWLAPLPEELLQLREAMTDEAIQAAVDQLSRLLGVQFPFNAPPPPQTHAVARPAAPGDAAAIETAQAEGGDAFGGDEAAGDQSAFDAQPSDQEGAAGEPPDADAAYLTEHGDSQTEHGEEDQGPMIDDFFAPPK